MLRIDVWSDLACPWCYIGKRRLEAAVRDFPHPTEVVWRSFELDPRAAPASGEKVGDMLARKYRMSRAQADAMMRRVTATGAADGIEMRFDDVLAANTFDAHRVVHLGASRGLQAALQERLFRAHFTEGAALGDHGTLTRLGGEAGLDPAEVTAVLASDRFAAEVRADEALAAELGISGVPFFVVGGRLGVSGAQPVEVMRGALDRAWADAEGAPERSPAATPDACGPDGSC